MERGNKSFFENRSEFLQLESTLNQEENKMDNMELMTSSQVELFSSSQEIKMLKNTRECTIGADENSESPQLSKENSIKIESL